jgi:hypothetical protein
MPKNNILMRISLLSTTSPSGPWLIGNKKAESYSFQKLNSVFIFLILLGHIRYTGGFIVTFLIRLILYISYIAPIISPPQPLLALLKAIARGFLVLFCIGI